MDNIEIQKTDAQKYESLIVKIESTAKYIKRLTNLRDDLQNCVEYGSIDQKVLDIIEDAIASINSIYIERKVK